MEANSNPKFIRDFSKEESQEEREQLATEIRNKRAEYFEKKESNFGSSSETESSLEKDVDEVEQLANTVENISTRTPSKISNLLEYIRIKSGLMKYFKQEKNKDIENEETQEGNIENQLVEENLSSSMKEAKSAIDNFYAKQKEKWINNPYSKEDIKKNFSPEHLASLSLEDYTLLLKRFPSQMVTHVTWQGIRDHLGAVNHHVGFNKMWNGFKDIIDDGHLKSAFAISVTEQAKRDEIVKFLNLENQTKVDAVKIIDELTGEGLQHGHGSFADRRSLHVATEQVADAHYGAETGNEIFFAYPSALIASQYVFSGQLSESHGDYHNNQWVFFEKDEGLDVNTGLVFIPKDVPVDKNTGSKYELNTNQEPIKNQELYLEIEKTISQDNFKSFAKEYGELLGSINFDVSMIVKGEDALFYGKNDTVKKIQEGIKRIEEEFLITDKNMQEIIFDYSFLKGVASTDAEEKKEFITRRLQELGREFTPAKDAIPSQQYWQEYFDTHKDKKPSKIVFYTEGDPTLALRNWKLENGLIKSDAREDLGFEEKRVNLSDIEDVKNKVPSIGRFRALAEDVIDEFYSK